MVKTHKSYHASGDVNMDYTGKGGTSHKHPSKEYWVQEDGTKLTKDSDGVWRTKDGKVFKGGK